MFVLVMSTSALTTEVICKLLELGGHDPIPVTNEADAHAALEFARFDAIVVDLDLVGTEAVARLRRSGVPAGSRPVPLIGVGSRTRGDAAASSRDRDVDRVVPKPIDPGELCAAVDPLSTRRSIAGHGGASSRLPAITACSEADGN